ncbi:MAG: beta-ketoacyl-ACP synthase III [Fusobacteriaceae bacterium]
MSKNVGIIGIGKYVPERIVTNFEFEKTMETSDEWIKTMTGVSERRFASSEEATSDLSIKAAQQALERANIDPEEIDMILVATITPDHLTPSTACIVQKKIGAVNAGALDVNAACSGFIYALVLADSLVKSGASKKVLVIGAETLSRVVDMEDRNTAILFGDGAAAAVVAEVESGFGILSNYLGADGDITETLHIKAGGSRNPINRERIELKEQYIKMKGREVFKFAVNVLPSSTNVAMERAGIKAEDIDIVVPHQANVRIIEAASKKIGIPVDKFYLNLDRYGNTSAASIGIALSEAYEKGIVKKGDMLAMTGFGGGLTFGSLIMRWAY